jgi:hypothetical protein
MGFRRPEPAEQARSRIAVDEQVQPYNCQRVGNWRSCRTRIAGGAPSVFSTKRADSVLHNKVKTAIIVEIVSDSSHTKDFVTLRDRYHAAGVPEYWIIDARNDTVHFQVFSRTDQSYVAVAEADHPQQSRVLGRALRIERSRNRAGRWDYQLVAEKGQGPLCRHFFGVQTGTTPTEILLPVGLVSSAAQQPQDQRQHDRDEQARREREVEDAGAGLNAQIARKTAEAELREPRPEQPGDEHCDADRDQGALHR